MFSKNEFTDSTIIALLFLTAINFMHVGQMLLPIICLIIFIDNKFKLKVNSWLIFIILCLFGLAFFAFSYKLGFYSTMGVCLPMAYYIGSNIKRTSEEETKKIIYLLTFGMATHIVLNMITDIVLDPDFLNSISHLDVWTLDKVSTTSTAVNSILIISLLYYFLCHEKNFRYKVIGIFLFLSIMIYDVALGRRTPLILTFICLITSFIIDTFIYKAKKINKKPAIITMIIFIAIILCFVLIYILNIFELRKYIENLGIIKKFIEYGLDTGRIDIFIEAIKLMPQHLWGGQEIYNVLGIQVHDLWMDTYDYAGAIPFALLIFHSVLFIKTFILFIKSKKISNDYKLLMLPMFLAITIQLFLEPIMTGSSLFIIIVIIIEAIIEKKVSYED